MAKPKSSHGTSGWVSMSTLPYAGPKQCMNTAFIRLQMQVHDPISRQQASTADTRHR